MSDIPKFAYIEAQIIHRAARAGALVPFARTMEREHGLKEGTLGSGVFDQTRFVSLLYSLILMPKELWELKANHRIYSRLESQFSLDGTKILLDVKPSASALQDFIYHLRNALAHALFAFKDGWFEFWDRDPRTKAETYRSKLPLSKLESFLEIVGSNLANFGSWPDTLDS